MRPSRAACPSGAHYAFRFLAMNKRQFLRTTAGLLPLALLPRTLLAAGTTVMPDSLHLIAAWRSLHELAPDGSSRGAAAQGATDYVGLLVPDWQAGIARIRSAVAVPDRVHGLLPDRDGGFLVCANRPGPWLMRGAADGTVLARQELEDERSGRTLNGHAVLDPSGEWLYTTESETGSTQGWIAVRRRDTLRKEAEFPTRGIEPHELLFDAEGKLVVANGGILRAAGDRKRDLERMDSSLVRLDPKSGERLGQWWLKDKRLSLRHLALGAAPATDGRALVGVALQAEHEDPAERAAAPILAIWNGDTLEIPSRETVGAGYCGDIATGMDGGFYLSAERSHRVTRWHPAAPERLEVIAELNKAGALAELPLDGTHASLIGSPRGLGFWHPQRDPVLLRWPVEIAPDNHWVAVSA